MSLGTGDLGERIDGDNLEPVRETQGDELMETYQICRARMETERCPHGSKPSPSAGTSGRNETG